MASRILEEAARRAGIPISDAESLIRELQIPTAGIAHYGSVSIPPFQWPREQDEIMRSAFPGWDGLTRGEYDATRAAIIWKAICEELLKRDETFDWEMAPWPYPKQKKE